MDEALWAGGDTTCIRRTDGSTYCFGRHGVTCPGDSTARADVCRDPWVSRLLPDTPKHDRIVVNDGVCVASTEDVLCWRAWPPDTIGFRSVDFLHAAKDWAFATDHVCAVRADSSIECLGLNDPDAVPRRVRLADGVRGLVAAGELVCGMNDETALCWTTDELQAVAMPALARSEALVAAGNSVCGRTDGALRCCEVASAEAQCVVVDAPKGQVQSFVRTWGETCVLMADETLHCTVRDGTLASPRPTRALALAGGRRHVCAITPERQTVCWGSGNLAAAPTPPDPPRSTLYAREGEACDLHLPCEAGWTCAQQGCERAEPCGRHRVCSLEGRCSLTSLGCVAKSDTDCVDSRACKEDGRCRAHWGRCIASEQEDNEEEEDAVATNVDLIENPGDWKPPTDPWTYVKRHPTNAPYGVECEGPGVCLERFDGAYFVLNRRWSDGYVIDLAGGAISTPPPDTWAEVYRRVQAGLVEVLHRKKVSRVAVSCPVAEDLTWLVDWPHAPVVPVPIAEHADARAPSPRTARQVNDVLGERAVFTKGQLRAMTAESFLDPNLSLHSRWVSSHGETQYFAHTILWSPESRSVYLRQYDITVGSHSSAEDREDVAERRDAWWRRIEAETLADLQALGVRSVRLHDEARCKLRTLSNAPAEITIDGARVQELHRLWRR